ncbi:hypothetical protein BDK51DRAFT_47933 [Blyttiomyces helicus]|uniref:Uncharacterized protein n=1 Tax=Blyttiomyces helicus TaxID=388810 RepID=A0A4P9W4A2_9FUNG|nr:hypothetical protein BDK51DRAFT_47933 [Blyttiomyces helicus]|eukprot:RKO85510.1 hypothetical protein BDK51DRAFT_47933 [Blyttiomyces helicus]
MSNVTNATTTLAALSTASPTMSVLPTAAASGASWNSVLSNVGTNPVQFTAPCGEDLLIDNFEVVAARGGRRGGEGVGCGRVPLGSSPTVAPRVWRPVSAFLTLLPPLPASQTRSWTAPAPTFEHKRSNALWGDWGIDGGNFTIDPTTETLTITPAPIADPFPPNATYNPNTVPTFNYFYTQFTNQRLTFDKACANLTPFDAVIMNVSAPTGFDFNITLTQRLKGDCNTRTFGENLAAAVEAEGPALSRSRLKLTALTYQVITIPFSDMATDLSGHPFNLAWNKDMTWVNLKGANANDSLILGNGVTLRGRSCTAVANATASTVAPTGAATPAASGAAVAPNGAATAPTAGAVPSTSANATVADAGTATATPTSAHSGAAASFAVTVSAAAIAVLAAVCLA